MVNTTNKTTGDTSVIPSVRIDHKTKKAAKIASAQDEYSMADGIRAFMRAWGRRDPIALKLIENAKAESAKSR